MTSITNEVPPSPGEPDRGNTAGTPLPSAWKRVRRSVWWRVLVALLIGVSIGHISMIMEVMSGLDLAFLSMIFIAYWIGRVSRVRGTNPPWRYALVDAAVVLAICLLLDCASGGCLYGLHSGETRWVAPLTALELFPARWHFSHLLVYGLAVLVAFWASTGRALRLPTWARPSAQQAPGECPAVEAAVTDARSRTPPGGRAISIRTIAALFVGGMVVSGGLGLLTRSRTSIHQLALHPDGQSLAIVQHGFTGSLFVRDLKTGSRIGMSPGSPDEVAWSPDGKEIAWTYNRTADKNSPAKAELNFLSNHGRSRQPALQETDKAFTGLAYSPDGRTLAVGSNTGEVLLWDTGTHVVRQRLHCQSAVANLIFAPSRGTLAVGQADGRIELWETVTLQPIRSWQGHSTEVRRLRFHPEGQRLFSAGARDRAIREWDPADGREVHAYRVPMNWVTDLALSPDGQTLAVSGGSFHDPGEVRLFDVGTADVREVFTVPENTVTAVAFSADGRTLFAGTRPPIDPLSRPWHGRVHRWDLTTGRELPPLH